MLLCSFATSLVSHNFFFPFFLLFTSSHDESINLAPSSILYDVLTVQHSSLESMSCPKNSSLIDIPLCILVSSRCSLLGRDEGGISYECRTSLYFRSWRSLLLYINGDLCAREKSVCSVCSNPTLLFWGCVCL